jgi:ABC-type lipoprotein export system ATPase subunit
MTDTNKEKTAIITCEDVYKTYTMTARPVEVLHGLELEVPRESSLTIMGASGSGKSTLLHVMGGLDKPERGRVLFNGQDVYRQAGRRRSRWLANEVGFVFQSYHLLPELSIVENVMLPAMSLPGAVRRSAANRRRALDLLDRVGLADRAEHRSTELSGGEQQRTALARALMNEPSLVLADEPTGNLDSETGGVVLDYLFTLHRENCQTLVIVTHNRAVAERADRMIFLRDGKVFNDQKDKVL